MNDILSKKNTNYDEIFSCFLDNCGIDRSQLPKEQEDIYRLIKNACRHYNNLIENENYNNIICDNKTETINKKLDDTHLLILSYYIRYSYLENELIEFEEIWSPFQRETGLKNYKDQTSTRRKTLQRTKQKIIELISNVENKDIMS